MEKNRAEDRGCWKEGVEGFHKVRLQRRQRLWKHLQKVRGASHADEGGKSRSRHENRGQRCRGGHVPDMQEKPIRRNP